MWHVVCIEGTPSRCLCDAKAKIHILLGELSLQLCFKLAGFWDLNLKLKRLWGLPGQLFDIMHEPNLPKSTFNLNKCFWQEQFFLPVTGDWVNLHHHRQGEINGISCFVTDSIASLVYTILISEQCHCVGTVQLNEVYNSSRQQRD